MESTTLVMDVGSGSIKAELAGAAAPTIFHNVIGSLKYSPVMPHQHVDGVIDNELLVSNDVVKHRGLLRVSYPMEHGHVTDWDGMGRVFEHIINTLGVPAKDHGVIVTEAPHTSRPQRAKMAQILFEQRGHPSTLFATQAILALYSMGHTTGVVLDVGDGVTHACPVVEGYSLYDSARRSDFGGRDVTQFLQYLLRQHGYFFDSSAEMEVVKAIKEERCTVAAHKIDMNDMSLSQSSGVRKNPFRHRLPDGSEIELMLPELQLAPEVLFNPSLVGSEAPGVAQLLCNSIRSAEMELRKDVYEHVFLTGGSTMFSRFPDRFLSEVAKLTPSNCKVKLVAPADRLYTTWLGGSLLAQLPNTKDMMITKAEWNEHGERIVHRKRFC